MSLVILPGPSIEFEGIFIVVEAKVREVLEVLARDSEVPKLLRELEVYLVDLF